MTDPLLVFGEAAYLSLLARRTLNYKRDAEQRGEEYHDVLPFTRLMCGAMARLRFLETATGYTPVVEVKRISTEEEARQIAKEITGSEMVTSQDTHILGATYTFIRKPT